MNSVSAMFDLESAFHIALPGLFWENINVKSAIFTLYNLYGKICKMKI